MPRFLYLICCGFTAAAVLFSSDTDQDRTRSETVVVTGTYEPLPLEEADRNVRSLDAQRLSLLSNAFPDLLRLDSSVDLRQRAPNGLQSDVSIRGGTFGQTLVLLDGMRLNDVQSGHHNLDLPVPLESIGSVEILKGSGSTLYGSDAIGGVVHFLTQTPETSEVRLRAAAGNFGVNQQRGIVTFVRRDLSQQISASRDFSTGFIPNRDYRNLAAASVTRFRSGLGVSRVVLSLRDSPFGAEQFYGNFNSWERTKTWWAAMTQDLGPATAVSFAFRRHTDLFVLYRDRPQVFTNAHTTETFQAAIRRRDRMGQNSTIFYGLEGFRDSVASNNLGKHDRARGAGYLAFDVRALRRFSLNAGVRDEVYGAGHHQISPTVSGGAWVSSRARLRASVSRAFRLPTYTDLYYQDPSNRGSSDLRPEKAWSYEAGVEIAATDSVRAEVTVFHRRETDGIDYVRRSAADVWRATNVQNLRFSGVEADLCWRAGTHHQVDITFTKLHGAQAALAGRESKYVFNFPVHNGAAGWQGTVRGWAARTRIGVVERFGRDPYAVWDLYGTRTRGRLRPFFQLTNLSGTSYQEIPAVAMPGRAIVGGIELFFAPPSGTLH